MDKKYKILIGPSETSGYYTNLNKGLNSLGHKSVMLRLGSGKHGYQDNEIRNIFVRIAKYAGIQFREKARNRIQKMFWKLVFMGMIPFVFLWAIIRFDVFILSGTKSYFNYYELPLLKLLRKRVIKVSLGSFTRPPFVDGSMIYGSYTDKEPSIEQLIQMTKKNKAKIIYVEKYVDIFVDHIPQGLFHEKSFVSLLQVGIPFTCDITVPEGTIQETASDRKVRVLHAPSYKANKGTDQVREMIQNLKSKGYEIDYVEVSNVPNEVVLKEISQCDFVIDEVYSDSPMATLAAEAAYFGKPTVIGGYYANDYRNDYPAAMIPPSLFCLPDDMEKGIERLITDPHFRKELGEKAKRFVIEKWNPESVASRYVQLIRGDFPDDWLVDPNKLTYIMGGGVGESRSREVIKGFIEKAGIGSLQLRDKPHLENAYVRFVSEKSEAI